jgi:hypothetical protein
VRFMEVMLSNMATPNPHSSTVLSDGREVE